MILERLRELHVLFGPNQSNIIPATIGHTELTTESEEAIILNCVFVTTSLFLNVFFKGPREVDVQFVPTGKEMIQINAKIVYFYGILEGAFGLG
jgi:hypothetical protein